MNTDQLRDAFEALLAADPDVVERDELAHLIASASRVRAMLDGFDVRCARRSRALADEGRAEPPGSMFNRAGNRSSKQSKEIADRSSACDAMPGFEDALNDGEVSSGHLDALAGARKGLNDAQRAEFDDHHDALVAAAAGEGVDTFARRCRELARRIVANSHSGSDADELDAQRKASNVKHWVDRITGMGHTHLELDPVRDATLWGAIDAYTARLRNADGNAGTPWSQLQVNAVVEAVAGDGMFDSDVVSGDAAEGADHGPARAGGGERLPQVPQMYVLVDLSVLKEGLARRTGSARPKTVCRCRCRPCGGCAARPRSCPWCWAATAKCSTSAAPNARPTGLNAGRCGRCTAPAPTPTAPSGSRRAASTT